MLDAGNVNIDAEEVLWTLAETGFDDPQPRLKVGVRCASSAEPLRSKWRIASLIRLVMERNAAIDGGRTRQGRAQAS